MNAPDPWADFDPPPAWNEPLTDAELDAWAAEQEGEQYQRDAIAGAKSEEAFAANQQEFAK